ncbi:MAG: AsmA-like C-terminal region-containing protein, partial [Sedimenticolaceae bacterium]
QALEVTELKGTTRRGDVSFDVSGSIGDLTALRAVELQLQASGPDLALVGPMIDVTLPKTGPFSATGRLTGSTPDLAFQDAKVRVARGELSVRLEGSINNVIGGSGVDLSLEAAGPNLAEFGQLIANTLPDTGAFRISGQLTGDFGELALADAKVALDWGGVALSASGTVGQLEALGGIDLMATAAGTSLEQVGRLLDQSWPSTGPFELSGRLRGSKEALAVRDAKARVSHAGLTLTATGRVANAVALSGVNVSFDAAGNDLAEIGPLVKQTLPKTGPFRVRGRLKGSRERLSLVDTRGSVSRDSARFSWEGEVADVVALNGVNLQVTASGEEFAELNPLIGKELPPLGSFKVTGDLTGSAAELVLANAFAAVGYSDLSGTVSVALNDRPKVTVRLNSGLIDCTPFMAAAKEDEKRHEESQPNTRDAPLFSDKSLGLDALGAFDADIELRMRRIRGKDAELEFGNLALSLINGELEIDTLEATYKGAKFSGHSKVDANSPPRVETDFLVQGFDLGRFLAETETTNDVEGLLDIAVDVHSQGDSVQALMANLNGSVGLVMGKGRASRYLDLLAEGLSTRVLKFWRHGKEMAKVECGVAHFDIHQGVATIPAFVFVTDAAIISAAGVTNLGTEQIDLLLKPQPRRASLFSLATNLRVTGNLTAPSVRPDTLALAEKGAWLLSSVAIGPLGLLAPFVHLGVHDKHPCDVKAMERRLIEHAENQEAGSRQMTEQ